MARLTCTVRSYSLDITDAQMIALLKSEGWGKSPAVTLLERLDKVEGVSRIEYDGHFGAAIYFNINADVDTAELRRAIIALIDEHLAALTPC